MLAKAIAVVGFAVASSAFAQGPELKIAFSGRSSGAVNDLFLMNPDGTEVTNLTSSFSPSVARVHISPTGRQIAFMAYDGTGAGSVQMYLIDADGTNLRQLTNLSHQYGPVCYGWLDDTRILFRWAPAASQGDLFTLDVITGQMQLLLAASAVGQGSLEHASISPDRRKIVFTGQAGSSSPTEDVYLLDLETHETRCLFTDATDNFQDWTPKWSSNTTVVWAHNMNPLLSNNFAVVEKSIDSTLPCTQYDRVALPATGSASLGVLDTIPDTRTCFVASAPDWLLTRVNLDTGATTIVLDDMIIYFADWGIIVPPDNTCPADLDNNGGVDGGDLATFLFHFEQGC